MLNKMTHLNLKEDISDLFHLGELIIELGVVSARELLAHQLVRLEKKMMREGKYILEELTGKLRHIWRIDI